MQYYELEPEQNTFSVIMADITHKCNMKCANCYIPNRNIPDLDVSKYYDFLSRLPHRVDLRIVGAEPTLNPNLPAIIEKSLDYGHRVVLLTNGLKLADESYCQNLYNHGLKTVYISMNGADDDQYYQAIDNGKYADLKVKALTNCLKLKMKISTGTIIAKGINENAIQKQVDLIVNLAQKLNINFDLDNPWKRLPILLRIKNIGHLGRSLSHEYDLSLQDLMKLTAEQLNVPISLFENNKSERGTNRLIASNQGKSPFLKYQTKVGIIAIKLADWASEENGIPDQGNQLRGRITEDFKIAPAAEHIKKNESGY
jgi:uncharacterized radical SAM superfamily Fe-S cluster-containing enzyme